MHDKPKYDPLRKIYTKPQFVILECPSVNCKYKPDGVLTAIRRDTYTHGTYKCDKCGSVLVAKDIITG